MADYAKITNFATKDTLPSGNSGKIVKGTEIDDEFNAISSAIASKANTNSPTFTGTPLAPTALAGTNTSQLATTAFVTSALAALITVPAGLISLWSGSIVSIPSGWYLCDGSNGTPDLRNKFIVGAGSTYAVNATGGSADAIVVSHSHTASTTATDSGHVHAQQTYTAINQGGSTPAGFSQVGGVNYAYNTASASANITASTTVASSGASGTNANLPPYYALAYIQKA